MSRSALFPALLRCLVGLAAATLLPAATAAQMALPAGDGYPPARFRITPFAGWATATAREESWSYSDASGASYRDRVDMHLSGGPAAGVVVDWAWRGPLSLLGGLTWVQRDDAEFSIADGEPWLFTSSNTVLLKAGVGLALHDSDASLTRRRLGSALFLAPFYMLDMPKEVAGIADDELFASAHHFGLNAGVTGELPFANDRLAIQLGFEDYFTFWNAGALQRLPDWVRNAEAGSATDVDAEVTHQWLVRAGLSIRFH